MFLAVRLGEALFVQDHLCETAGEDLISHLERAMEKETF